MKILKVLLIIIVILVVAALVATLMGPKDYRIERSAIVHANDSITHDYIAQFHNWESWSPWKEHEPSARYSFAGVDGTVGSSHSWEGEEIGQGSMTWKDVSRNNLQYDLAFVKPWQSTSTGGFILEPVGENQTKVTWYDMGDIPLSQRAMFLMMDMDGMMGPDFERGLFKIDSLATITQNTMILNQNLDTAEVTD